MTMERDSLVARLGKLHEYDLVLDTNAYPKGPMAEGRDVYRVIGWEGADRGGLLLSEVEAREVRAAFRESSAAAALSRPEQVVIPASERPASDALIEKYASSMYGRIVGVPDSVIRQQFSEFAQELAVLASAPASPAIGVQAVKGLADRVRALLLVDQPASWEERRKIVDELESLSALHPAPEAASAGGAVTVIGDERIFPNEPFGSDTTPSPKGVSDGVRERIKTFLCVRESARADDYPWSQLNDATDILRDIEAALSQEPVPATAEERAASKEGA